MKLFVYGTLRDGAISNDKYLFGKIIKKEDGYVKGELFTLKDRIFPALVDGERLIKGDVFTLSNDFDFSEMDKYEEYFNDYNKNLYNRENIDVVDKNGNFICNAQVYYYNLKRNGSEKELDKLILSNDFLNK